MKRLATINLVVVLMLVLAACGSPSPAAPAATQAAPAATAAPANTGGLDQYGERYDDNPALEVKAVGTSEGVPDIAKAAIYRAGLPVTDAMRTLALKCFKDKVCDTGSGGKLTLAIADGFGENVWRQITLMEAILQALTYPEIGKIMYSSAKYDTQQAISDIKAFVAQDVSIIIGYPDAGDALLPAIREATAKGIPYVPYSYGKIGEPGKDYLTFVGEDVCLLGQHFAETLNKEVGTGKVAFLGGTPGNPLSAYWQGCEKKALGPGLTLVATADTMWTQQGALEAMSGIISANPDLKGVSYEYADGFRGGLQAYKAANLKPDIVLTLRTDEMGLFCDWADLKDPNFKIFYSAGGNFQARVAVTAAMMSLKGAKIPSEGIIVPARMRQVDASTCDRSLPEGYPISSLVPTDVVAAMFAK
jgi:ribose transport system substrate-binding protein